MAGVSDEQRQLLLSTRTLRPDAIAVAYAQRCRRPASFSEQGTLSTEGLAL